MRANFFGEPKVCWGDEVQVRFNVPDEDFAKYREELPQLYFVASYTPSEHVVDVWYHVRERGAFEPVRAVFLSDSEHDQLIVDMTKYIRENGNEECNRLINS